MQAKIPLFTRIGMFLDNFKFDKERVYAIQVSAENRELVRKVASLQAQVGMLQAEKKQIKEDEKDLEKEREIAIKLNEETEKLNAEDLGKPFSFTEFYAKYFGIKKGQKSKFAQKLIITDRNGENSHPFGDFQFTTKNFFVIRDNKGGILHRAFMPRSLFKLEAFPTMLKKGIIIMNIDKNGDYVPEVDDIEMEVPVFNEETNQYETTILLKDKARALIVNKDTELRIAHENIEQLENVITDMKTELRELRRTKNIYAARNNIGEADKSGALTTVMELTKKDYEKSHQIIKQMESGAMKEDMIDVYASAISDLMKKLEKEEGQITKERVKAEFKDMLDLVSSIPLKPIVAQK